VRFTASSRFHFSSDSSSKSTGDVMPAMLQTMWIAPEGLLRTLDRTGPAGVLGHVEHFDAGAPALLAQQCRGLLGAAALHVGDDDACAFGRQAQCRGAADA